MSILIGVTDPVHEKITCPGCEMHELDPEGEQKEHYKEIHISKEHPGICSVYCNGFLLREISPSVHFLSRYAEEVLKVMGVEVKPEEFYGDIPHDELIEVQKKVDAALENKELRTSLTKLRPDDEEVLNNLKRVQEVVTYALENGRCIYFS